MTPSPSSRAAGIRSPSTVRSEQEYSIWRRDEGVQFFSSAIV